MDILVNTDGCTHKLLSFSSFDISKVIGTLRSFCCCCCCFFDHETKAQFG